MSFLTSRNLIRSHTVLIRTRVPCMTTLQHRNQYRNASDSTSNHSGIVMDQTKEDNDPSADKRSDHRSQAEMPGTDKGRDHPAKQADTQKEPTRSTGIRKEGAGGIVAGEGKDEGVTTDRGAGPYMKQ